MAGRAWPAGAERASGRPGSGRRSGRSCVVQLCADAGPAGPRGPRPLPSAPARRLPGPMPSAPEYVRTVLSENFEDAKALFLEPLLAIHGAHLVMLAERGIVGPDDARTLRDAAPGVSRGTARRPP